jgi:rRNA-processing protein FCF1
VLLIDGNNLLHRVSGSADPTAQRTLIARLRNAIPSTVPTILMLDGHSDAGTASRERIAKGFEVRHSGSISADDALVYVIRDQPHDRRATTTIVTDDRSLTERARQLGALTQRLAWLERHIDQPTTKGSGIGSGPPPPGQPEVDDREPWRPGRGATTKRGNPRRAPSRRRGATGRG